MQCVHGGMPDRHDRTCCSGLSAEAVPWPQREQPEYRAQRRRTTRDLSDRPSRGELALGAVRVREVCVNSALRDELGPDLPSVPTADQRVKKCPRQGDTAAGGEKRVGVSRSRSMAGGSAMEMREPRAHEIAREAAPCMAEIDETIPVLLEAMVLKEIWLTRTLARFFRRATKISRRRRSGKMLPSRYRDPPLAASGQAVHWVLRGR